MKKSYLTICFLLFAFYSFADDEQACVITNTGSSGQACSASSLGPVNPCSSLSFVVNYRLPIGFAIVAKYEWFVNGVLVKTSTDPSDPILPWTIVSNSTSVYCKVTYKANNGSLSQAYTSTTFTPVVKSLNFNNITTSTPPPNYGCTNTVSYSLATYNCGGFCAYTYTVSDYSITWQPPAGWTQTSISTLGNDVSFTPDATTGGTLTATITMPCGYSETRTFTITRAAAAPTFEAGNPTNVCTSSATFSVNPVCGASSYTYSLSGSPGITFASNALQTLTTTSTSVALSLSGSPSTISLKAKANYPGNNSSSDVTSNFNYGAVPPSPISFTLIDPTFGKIYANIDPVVGATSYNWYKNGALNSLYHGTSAHFSIPIDQCDVEYDISVEVINACGTSEQTHANAYVPCDGYYMMSPNPATNEVTVSADQSKSTSGQKTFSEVRIYDLSGNLKKAKKYNNVKSATIVISDLSTGSYTIQIIGVGYIETKSLIIQK